MKGGIISFLWVVIFLSWSCVKENLDDCPDPVPVPTDNLLVLQFEYFDVKGLDVFDERIDTIDVAIFDESHILQIMDSYAARNLVDRSVQYELDPGTYYVICWSNNKSARDEIPAPSYNSNIHIEDIVLNHKNSNGIDPLHYAPDYREESRTTGLTYAGEDYSGYKVEVAPKGTTYKKVPFMCAYRTINVYISGLDGITDPQIPKPVAGVTAMPGYYTYYLETMTSISMNFEQSTHLVTIENEPYARAVFYVPHFEATNTSDIYVQGTGLSTYRDSVRLEEFLQKNNITLYAGDELELNICFKYLNGIFVGVEIPSWKTENVIPGF